MGLRLDPEPPPQTVFGTNHICSPTPIFAHIHPNIQYFSNH